jgi:oxalate---CoA ligase
MMNDMGENPPDVRVSEDTHAQSVISAQSLLQFFILKVWQKLLGRTDIGIDEDFIAAGGTLALSAQMISAIQVGIGQKIPELTHRNTYTIRELEAVILRESAPPTELIKIVRNGRGVPLLFCHGDYAMGGLYAHKLAETLTCDQPVYLLHPYPKPDSKLTIKEMARAYTPDILAKNPTGPFRLVGYCNGGQLAWEIVRQLEALDREVEFIVLVETVSLNARPILGAIGRLAEVLVAATPRTIGDKIARECMDAVWKRATRRSAPNPYLLTSTPYSQAVRNYIPRKINAPTICIVSEESRNRIGFSPEPWKILSPKVDYRYVAGNHLNDLTALMSGLTPLLNELLSHNPK